MTGKECLFSTIDNDSLVLNENEVALRLKSERGYTSDTVKMCEERLRDSVACRYAALRLGVKRISEGVCDLGFGEVNSQLLYNSLEECGEAYVFAVTLGINVDRLLLRLSAVSQAEHFITDALASAMAEAACDMCDKILRDGHICRHRISPGYGDLPLEIQPDILSALNARRVLNITLNKSYLMSPSKSITAIMGIINE